jgi:hypothetical protein
VALIIAQDYIMQALRKCGQMRPNYIPAPELLNDGLNEWGSIFDGWAGERSMGFSTPQYVYPVTGPGSQQSGNGYLIGPVYAFTGTLTIGSPIITAVADPSQLTPGEQISGAGIPANSSVVSTTASTVTISANATANGSQALTATPDFVGPRPPAIVRANLKFTSGTAQPVYIHLTPISAEEWSSLAIRQIPAIDVTSVFYYDAQYPNGVFNVFPPLNGNAIELFTNQFLGVPLTVASPYSAPPAYRDAVIDSLAERLWPMCTNQVAVNRVSLQWLAGTAYESRQKLRTLYRQIPRLASDFRGGGYGEGFYDSFVTDTGLPT